MLFLSCVHVHKEHKGGGLPTSFGPERFESAIHSPPYEALAIQSIVHSQDLAAFGARLVFFKSDSQKSENFSVALRRLV